MSFFRYPGGKAKLRGKITELLSVHCDPNTEYREPFFGGGSIGMKLMEDNNDKVTRIWINDKDVGIACLWSAVITAPNSLKLLIENFIPSVNAFHAYRDELKLEEPAPKSIAGIVSIGYKKLVVHQTSYSGLGTKSGGPLGGETQLTKDGKDVQYPINCRWSPGSICSKIDKLHERLHQKVRGNRCTTKDFVELIEDDSCKALLYLDPPYYDKGVDLYQHFFAEDDHIRLMKALKKTSHKWLLSYDDCSAVRELYAWADIATIDVNYSITATKEKDTGKRLSRTKPELLISPKGIST